MRRVALVCTVLFVLLVGSANAWKPGEEASAHRCNHGHVMSCIRRASLHDGISYGTMRYIAYRESRYQPGAVNKQAVCQRVCEHAAGLFQFLPSTYAQTPYARAHSIFSAKYNALAAGWYMRHHGFGAWGM